MPESDRHSNGVSLPRRGTAGDRPRVLFLSCHLPWPPLSGGRRRELELIARLSGRFDIRLVVVSKTAEQDELNAPLLAPFCQSVDVVAAQVRPRRPGCAQAPYQVLRHRSASATRRVREIIADGRVDLVHVEGFYLMQHVPEWVEAPVLLVEQNIEFELARQRAHTSTEHVARLDSLYECMHTQSAERACWRRATRLAAVTWEDREAIRSEIADKAVDVVPDGADHLPARPRASRAAAIGPRQGPQVTLLANFAYAPNVDAAVHFCHNILPRLRAAVPDVHVWLVGNEPPAEILALSEDRVAVTGYVADVLPYVDAADVMVCPLRIGGGIKVKVIEALRRGKAIVSTSIGAQGLPPAARAALVVADEPRHFAAAVAALLGDRLNRRRLERRAAAAAGTLPTWDEAAARLAGIYDELIEGVPAEGQPARPRLAARLA